MRWLISTNHEDIFLKMFGEDVAVLCEDCFPGMHEFTRETIVLVRLLAKGTNVARISHVVSV